MNTERNTDICRLYASGITIADLAVRFSISRQRVRQLLRKAGIFKQYRDHAYSTDGEREAFLGVNLTAEAKDALRVKAEEAGVSMSRLVSDAVDEMVK